MIKKKIVIRDGTNNKSLKLGKITQIEKDKLITNPTFQKYFIKEEFSELAELEPENPVYKFSLTHFIFFELRYIQNSIIQIFKLKNLKLSLWMKFNIFRLNHSIKIYLSNLNTNKMEYKGYSKLNIENLVTIENEYQNLISLIKKYKKKYSIFVEALLAAQVSIPHLENIHKTLIVLAKAIEASFSNNRKNPRSISIYSKFCLNYRFDKKKTSALIKVKKVLLDKVKDYKMEGKQIYDIELMYTKKCSIIKLGADIENLGKIIEANDGASKLTGYSKMELMSMNVRKIMTPEISKRHQSYLLNAYKTGEYKILYQEQRNFVLSSKGNCVPISLLIKPLFDLRKNLFQYISNLQPISSNYRFIITNSKGVIDSMSSSLYRFFFLQPELVFKNEFSVNKYIPELNRFFKKKEKRIRKQSSSEIIKVYLFLNRNLSNNINH